MSVPEQLDSVPEVRAQDLLKNRSTWAFPVIVGSLMIMLMTLIYFGSIVDPTGHLSGLPVWVVNQDKGAPTAAGRMDLGGRGGGSARRVRREVSTKLSLKGHDVGGS